MRGPIELLSIEERYWLKVDTSAGPNGCWPWTAGVNPSSGYGVFHAEDRRTVNAHRYGAVLAGLVELDDARHVDHTCHNDKGCPPGPCPHRLCQNPAHFEAVTNTVNVNRSHNSNARKTHCPRNHEYTASNTRLQRRGNTTIRKCITCEKERGH